MTEDTMRRFAESDPARELDPAPDPQLLARTIEQPRPGSRTRLLGLRSRPRRFASATVAALIVVIAAMALLVPSGGPTSGPASLAPGSLALAAQAYKLTNAASGEIVHTLATTTSTGPGAAGKVEAGSIEEWHRGRETHRLERYGLHTALDHVIDADGVMRQVSDDGTYRIIRPSDNEDAANVIGQQQAGFVEEFRMRYEQGRLDPAGDVRFAGRPAQRYLVTPEAPPTTGTGLAISNPPQPEQAFYIDRATGKPLGYTSVLKTGSAGEGNAPAITLRYELIVRKIESLAPTAENLAKLRTLTLPRRRDAAGCVRGPAPAGHSSEAAPKSDCGGTPGAALPG